MRTEFSQAQLADPHLRQANDILRKCVHCGFCTATCPTYVELGNELDSPRGRIYLIKDMLENDKPASAEVVTHIDRCLTCLACMTTCPSGVDYMHLVDRARVHIEETFDRPLTDRLVRGMLAAVLPYPGRFRLALAAAYFGKPLAPFLRRMGGPLRRMGAMLKLAPASFAGRLRQARTGTVFPPSSSPAGRVAILTGCAQPVLDPGINAAAIRLLNRLGIEVVLPAGEGCCGALVHHMGREAEALAFARANVDAWMREIDGGGLDAILITTSGCGTTVKDYGHLLAGDLDYAEKAARVAALAKDISEYLAEFDLPEPANTTGLAVAYHSACSLQHGQKIVFQPKMLLEKAGYVVRDVPEGHLCCGSAGTYNVMQSQIADRLRTRKVANIESLRPDLIAAGNLGCMTQIGAGTSLPVVHTIEL
ncbi:MAG TPA: glycolate oxidase subunit GlcF, partial [Afifellaceae bacterium]|nr:glycolate oxidase subunit GlcF [Afifellaceae bacterium]